MSDSGSNKGTVVPMQTNKNESVDIIFKNIQYSVKTKDGDKQILKGVDGICKSG